MEVVRWAARDLKKNFHCCVFRAFQTKLDKTYLTSTTSNSTSTLFVLAKSNASISLTRGPVNLELIMIWTISSASKLQIVKLILISIKFQLKTTYYHCFRHRILEAEDKVYLSINIIGEKYQQRANLTIFFSICCNVNATRL